MTKNRFQTADWLLNWVDDHPTTPTNFSELSNESGFRNEDLLRSAKMLESLNLMTFETDWSQELFHGRLTGAGQHLVFAGTSVADFGSAQGNTTTNNAVNVHGDVHGGLVGINNEQNVTVNVSSAQIQELIDAFRKGGHEELADIVENETDGGTQPRKIAKAMREVLSALGDAGSAVAAIGPVGAAVMGLF